MAEFLHILSEQYDYPQLADEVLRYRHSNLAYCRLTLTNLFQRPEQQGV